MTLMLTSTLIMRLLIFLNSQQTSMVGCESLGVLALLIIVSVSAQSTRSTFVGRIAAPPDVTDPIAFYAKTKLIPNGGHRVVRFPPPFPQHLPSFALPCGGFECWSNAYVYV